MDNAPATANAGYQVNLPEFEGPLDLLLHLVKRHELDIFDIPISFVTEKYLEFLDMMKAFSLDVAGEYLLMAATLAYIKSRELLPRQDDELAEDEEGGDPRAELIRRLLEYQKYKEAAEVLADQPLMGRLVFSRGAKQEAVNAEELPLTQVSTFALVEALARVLERSKLTRMHDVIADRISITDRINEIVDLLDVREAVRFEECFEQATGRQGLQELVVTFLALLEMARLKMIRLLQHTPLGEIYVSRSEDLHRVEEEKGGEPWA